MSIQLILGDELGNGSRRICYRHRLDAALCVKVMRRPDQVQDFLGDKKRPLQKALQREARWPFLNTNISEFRYYQSTIKRMPKEIQEIYPQHLELLYDEDYGPVLIEDLVCNYDGSPVLNIIQVLLLATADQKVVLIEKVRVLFDLFYHHAISFYDFNTNIMVQWTSADDLQLRISDIDPAVRGGGRFLFPLCPWLRRMKMARRYKKFMKAISLIAG